MISVNLLCVKILIIYGIYISVKLYKCGIYFIKEKKREKIGFSINYNKVKYLINCRKNE